VSRLITRKTTETRILREELRMVCRPDVLMLGAYPTWDMEHLDARYTVHRLWEAANRDGMIDANRNAIRAIATRGELS
jgi:hypothetical protein